MRLVFLAEPFGETRLLRCLFGAVAELPVPEAAVLPGHELHSDDGGLRLGPVRRADGATPGWTMALSEPQRARLDFWMATIGAKLLVARVACGAEKRIVDTFVLNAGDAPRVWQAADWDGEWRDLMAEAVEEVLRHHGQREAERMPELLHGISYRALARARGAADRAPVRLRSGLGAGDIEPLRLDLPYAAYFCVEEHHLRHRRFDGEMSPPILRAAFTSGDAVTVLPFDPRAGTVLLIEQFRAGPLARRDPRPWCLETVAGRCDALETPETTVRREAREEAELELGGWSGSRATIPHRASWRNTSPPSSVRRISAAPAAATDWTPSMRTFARWYFRSRRRWRR